MLNEDLWRRISAYDIDHAEAKLTFTKRFARDHHLKYEKAKKYVAEYKKFMYLVAVSDKPLTPSHRVDLVWHLHMTYTDSYWNDLCRDVLGKEVSHNPTKGRKSDSARYADQYAETLGLYEKEFGEKPPDDVWEPIIVRTRQRSVTVNTNEHYVIPKPTVLANAPARLGGVAVVTVATAGYIVLNSDDIESYLGIAFLYVIGVIAALFINSNSGTNRSGTPNDAGGCGGGGDSDGDGGDGCSGCGGCGGCG